MAVDYWSVPPMWRGETVVIVASGPSLSDEQLALCRDRARMIVINDNYLRAPWADLHYFCDSKWFNWSRDFESPAQEPFGRERALKLFHSFEGRRAALESAISVRPLEPTIKFLRNDSNKKKTTTPGGICWEPDGLRTGRNSGYQTINLAYHTGASRVLLLGYDMHSSGANSHWFGKQPVMQAGRPVKQSGDPDHAVYASSYLPHFPTLARELVGKMEVINCTPNSALKAFPWRPLEDML